MYNLVDRVGLEPTTFWLKASYSRPLSYRSMKTRLPNFLAPGEGLEPPYELALRRINSAVPYQLGDPGINN